ncbi:MAG: NAD-dependent epimerase/dehydratase family protein [Flavobacteriales bacterium]
MQGKRIIVTGGAGFIGSHLVSSLVKSDNEVIVVDTLLRGNKLPKEVLAKIEFHKLDVCDSSRMIELAKGVDIIFHFAAILGVDIVADNPIETMETEVNGMQSVARAAIENGVSKIVYASTSGVYGHLALEKSVDEQILVDPRTSYAMAKRYNEIYLASLFEEKGINSIALRFFNVYGLRQDNRMVVPRFIEQARSNKPITVYGTGEQTRDFTYVDDAIHATLLLAQNINGFEIFNVANEKEATIGHLAELIKTMTQSASPVEYIDAPKKRYDYEVGRRFGSSEKLMKHVNYKPSTRLEDGLEILCKDSIN